MGGILHGASPEEERAFVEERRKSAFLAASQSPSLWFSTAARHKRAADILYEIAHAAHDRETARAIEDAARNPAEMTRRGVSSWSESKALEGAELSDFLDSELLSEYLLLAGYALECVLKGCLLAIWPRAMFT